MKNYHKIEIMIVAIAVVSCLLAWFAYRFVNEAIKQRENMPCLFLMTWLSQFRELQKSQGMARPYQYPNAGSGAAAFHAVGLDPQWGSTFVYVSGLRTTCPPCFVIMCERNDNPDATILALLVGRAEHGGDFVRLKVSEINRRLKIQEESASINPEVWDHVDRKVAAKWCSLPKADRDKALADAGRELEKVFKQQAEHWGIVMAIWKRLPEQARRNWDNIEEKEKEVLLATAWNELKKENRPPG